MFLVLAVLMLWNGILAPKGLDMNVSGLLIYWGYNKLNEAKKGKLKSYKPNEMSLA